MPSKYYKILGVDPSASLGAIKKAYRSKAKLLHPDVNKAADANEQFILLNEAYEYLENVKTGKVYRNRSTRKKTTRQKTRRQAKTQSYASEEEWQAAQRAKARKRAQAYAKMKFADYQKTEAYQTTNALGLLVGILMDIAVVLIGITLISVCLFYMGGIAGVAMGIIFAAGTSIHRKSTYTGIYRDLQNARAAIELLSETKIPLIFGLAALNLVLMWTVTLQTLWVFSHLFFFYSLLANIIVFLFWPTEKPEKQNEALWMIGYIPGAINFFFLLNFVFSSNPVIESHKFNSEGWTIELRDNSFSEYRWLRLYPKFTISQDKSRVQFEIEEGLLGYKVLKDAKFYDL